MDECTPEVFDRLVHLRIQAPQKSGDEPILETHHFST